MLDRRIVVIGFVCAGAWGCVGDATSREDTDGGGGGQDAASTPDVISVPDANNAPDVSLPPDAGPAWSPSALGSAVVLWLDGDSNVTLAGGKVAAWGDKSSAGNSAIQAASASRPAVSPTAYNGHKAIRFSACNVLSIADATSLQWGTGGFTMAAVVSYTNPTSSGPPTNVGNLYSKQTQASPYEGVILRGNSEANTTSRWISYVKVGGRVESAQAGYNDGVLHRVVLRRTIPTTLDMRVDGVSASANVPSTDVSAPGVPATLGAQNTTGECLVGDVAEVIAINKGLDGSETAALEGYLKAKYGL